MVISHSYVSSPEGIDIDIIESLPLCYPFFCNTFPKMSLAFSFFRVVDFRRSLCCSMGLSWAHSNPRWKHRSFLRFSLVSQKAATDIRRYVKGGASFSSLATAGQVQIAIFATWIMKLGKDSALKLETTSCWRNSLESSVDLSLSAGIHCDNSPTHDMDILGILGQQNILREWTKPFHSRDGQSNLWS